MLDRRPDDVHEVVDAGAGQGLEPEDVADHGQADELAAGQGGALAGAGPGHPGLLEGGGHRCGDLLGGVGLHRLGGAVVGGDPAQQGAEDGSVAGVVPGGHGQADQARARAAQVAGQHRGDLLGGADAHVHGGAEQVALGAEVVGDERRVHPRGAGHAADRRGREAPGKEGGARGVEDRIARGGLAVTGAAARPSSPRRAGGRGGGGRCDRFSLDCAAHASRVERLRARAPRRRFGAPGPRREDAGGAGTTADGGARPDARYCERLWVPYSTPWS